MSDIASPCVRNCCLDEREVCLGCGRSLDEIKVWSEANDTTRLAILDQAARRRAEREARMQAWREGREQA